MAKAQKIEEAMRAFIGYIDYTARDGYVDTGIVLEYAQIMREAIESDDPGHTTTVSPR